MTITSILQNYAQRIRNLRRAHANVSEPALAPAFHEFLDQLINEITTSSGLSIVPEYANPGIGRPDIAFVRSGAPARAFLELKAPDKSANPTLWRTTHDRRQFDRLKELRCWASSNFIDIFLFDRDEEQSTARIVPQQALNPDQSDTAANRLIRQHDATGLLNLLERLVIGAGTEPLVRDAPQLATFLAHSARLVRGIVQDRLHDLRTDGITEDPLLEVHAEFQTVLYAHPEAGGYPTGDFDVLFSSAFAQTLAFGLLLVREGSGRPVNANAYTLMPAEHPLMRTTLRVLTQNEILEVIGVGFTVLLDTVNSFDPIILTRQDGQPDPILYFYEDFLSVFDPEARERHGVYFTPVPIVRFIVAALDRIANAHLHLTGLRDGRLTILDPAAGTGTFLLGVAERVYDAASTGGAGRAELELRALSERMFGLELLVGPYAVAHYRLHHALGRLSPEAEATTHPRLGVYLADTLAEPGAAAPAGRLGFVSAGIGEERRAADHVKSQQPILAIIGNPPYRRLEEGENESLVGRWMDDLWDDLKRPVRRAGKGGQLNTFPELSVAFWRWSMWKLFEAENAPGRGIIALITNRKYLTGWPYAGLRKMMRDRFDRIEIIDLRGDIRLGPRAGIARDVGVFDIQVGTAITIAIADGSRAGEEAEVYYLDAWADARYARSAKLDWLTEGTNTGSLPGAVRVRRNGLENFRPKGFSGTDWPSLRDCFAFAGSGLQTKRDGFIYDASADRLRRRIEDFLVADDEAAQQMFHDTGYRTARSARSVPFDPQAIRAAAYRPLDSRFIYLQHQYGDRLRPRLQRVWGETNVALYTLPRGIGTGPAVWCHALLPDYHGFRGSYGGYAFPLYDRRPTRAAPNLWAELVDSLTAVYGTAVSAENVFDAILSLLSASSYTLRFAEDLEDEFPHIPFPADYAVFDQAAVLGAQIRQIETFGRPPTVMDDPSFVQLATPPTPRATLHVHDPVGTTFDLCADGSGTVMGLPEHLWEFGVSGYPLLRRWIEGRAGQTVDLPLFDAFRDICARIHNLRHLQN